MQSIGKMLQDAQGQGARPSGTLTPSQSIALDHKASASLWRGLGVEPQVAESPPAPQEAKFQRWNLDTGHPASLALTAIRPDQQAPLRLLVVCIDLLTAMARMGACRKMGADREPEKVNTKNHTLRKEKAPRKGLFS